MPLGDTVSGESEPPLEGRLGDASNVLVLGPALDNDARRAYFESLLPDPRGLNVVAVQYTRTPDEWLEDWRRYVGAPPNSCHCICATDSPRSAAATAADGTPGVVTTIEQPGDLTGLGIAIGERLSEWRGTPTVLTFDSLTVLLQYVDRQRAFRFLHVMTTRIADAGAVAHYHMDPAAHEEQTVATLSSLFDAVVEYDSGGWRVR